MKFSVFGFTLIELLVVMALIVVLTTFTLANVKDLRENQALKNGILDLQNLLRLAQSNANASLNCSGQGGAKWKVEFLQSLVPGTDVKLKCEVPSANPPIQDTIKTLSFNENVLISSIVGSCNVNLPLVIDFSELYGDLSFEAPNSPICVSGLNITVSLTNTITGDQKAFKIDKGGAVDVN